MTALSKYIFYPLWDLKDKSQRLREMKNLEQQQWWGREQLDRLQWERLETLLRYAGDHSNFYRNKFVEHGIDPAKINTVEQFRRIPITTKQDIRNNLDDFISDQFQRSKLVTAKTGGSTGVSLHLYFDETAYGSKGTHIKCNPAIKSPADRQALLQAVTD